MTLNRALYGLPTAAISFHDFLGDTLRRIGFIPSRADQELWIIKAKDHDGYDYLATHVDDLIIAAKRPGQYIAKIEQEFGSRNIEDFPKFYLGCNVTTRSEGIHISCKTYIEEALRVYQEQHGALKKQNTPMKVDIHPELDSSEMLNDKEHKHFQKIMGIAQWIVTSGRFDICHAVASLSRFAAAPRRGHLDMARYMLGYLKKYPKKGYYINEKDPQIIDNHYEKLIPEHDFGTQYHYFKEEIDPRFPEPVVDELKISIFCDANHGHDKVTGRSITGIIIFVGSTPILWESKRQNSVQTSTYGAEFTALKRAVEHAVTIRYHLRSMGITVNEPSCVYIDNRATTLNTNDPDSTLNKKNIALAYHFVREHVSGKVVKVHKIKTEDNYADPFTKALTSVLHNICFYQIQRN